MKKHNKNASPIPMILLCVSFIAYLIIDYFNVPSAVGFRMDYINYDALGIFAGALVASFIFVMTYHFVDKENIRKQNNQSEIAILLLKTTYEKCKFYAQMVTEIQPKLVELTDFDKRYDHDSPTSKYAAIPFENDRLILQLAVEGALTQAQINTYFSIKRDFSSYVSMSVMFFDRPEKHLPLKTNLMKAIEAAIQEIA